MVLRIHSDGFYLLESHARGRSREKSFLGDIYKNQSDNNGAIITIYKIIKNVIASASEAQCGALFVNTR